MKKKLAILLLFFIFNNFLFSHEAHHIEKKEIFEATLDAENITKFSEKSNSWAQWVGKFHFTLIHFPIALIMMSLLSEFLFLFSKKEIYTNAAHFMIIAAAILTIPTLITGLLFRFTSHYSGILSEYIFWHMLGGITLSLLTILTVVIRQFLGVGKFYYSLLIFLFLLVSVTAYLGGSVTHGIYHMYPPV